MINNELLQGIVDTAKAKYQKHKYESEWYNLRPLLGHAN